MDLNVDPCSSFDSLELSNPDDCKRILRRDKHTRIEGLVIETLFREQLLAPAFSAYSTGWWFGRKERAYHAVKLVRDLQELSTLDGELWRRFSAARIPAFVVAFDSAEKEFYYASFTSDVAANWSARRRKYPAKPDAAPLPDATTRATARLDQALAFLEDTGQLERAAMERLFANCRIHTHHAWDLDALTLYNGQVLAFEVKQKYPTRRGTFGLNRGLAALLTFLHARGVRVIHVILSKPLPDENIPALDFYFNEEWRRASWWLGANFSPEILSGRQAAAPARTSIYTQQELWFHHIEARHFARLATLGESSPALLELVKGALPKLRDIHALPRLG